MSPIAVRDVIPDGELVWYDDKDEQQQQLSIHTLAAGKKVILFGVPGAFTPIYSIQHVPSFIQSAEQLKSKGVAEILLISGN
ncbi:peroxiredoxin-2C [Canna indica]|uniref:glutaredoxin-dependent peroxiredoxin n=1 Tax=Canna indica TaxID=4628 RepID=A0AAQ3Q7D1_9LILI|nr:peroxiredoxin-2C [Canna indica]